MPSLRITCHGLPERTCRVDGQLTFGRGSDCDIILTGSGVSRRHGRFLQASDGSWWVEDLQSKNGILVNGRLESRHRLHDGDEIGIGEVIARFVGDGAAVLRPPSPAGSATQCVTLARFPMDVRPQIERDVHVAAAGIEARRLASLYDLSRKLLDQHDVRGLINVACSVLISSLDAGVVVIGLTCDPTREPDLLFVAPERPTGVTLSLSILQRTLQSRHSILIGETSSDINLVGAQSIVSGRIRSAMCVPLMREERVTGFIYVDSRDGGRTYDEQDLDFSAAVGALVGTAVEVARLHESELARQRMEAELAAARRVQQAILPSHWPSPEGWEIDGLHRSCHEVGGDYHDAILDKRGRLWLVIADVCGKGAAAALLASSVHALLHALVDQSESPAVLLTRMNDLLLQRQVESSFVTCLVVLIDAPTGEAVLSSAGHPYPVVLDPTALPRTLCMDSGLILGAIAEADFPEVRWSFPAAGATLFMYTDGLSESLDPQGRQFGSERIEESLSGSGTAPPGRLIEALLQSLGQFRGDAPQSDDLTLLVCRRKPLPSGS